MDRKTPPPTKMRPWVMIALFGPFILFLALVIIMYNRMETSDPASASLVPNALQDKTVPDTHLPLLSGEGSFNPADYKGQVLLVNFWGSWCPPCRDEHPVLMQIAQDSRFLLMGINYKDKAVNAERFLNSFGNPFKVIGFDSSGKAAINWGVYGPPETFIVSKDGIILHKHIGPLTPEIYQEELLPIIEKALQ